MSFAYSLIGTLAFVVLVFGFTTVVVVSIRRMRAYKMELDRIKRLQRIQNIMDKYTDV
jgi:hypothetical protein